MPLTPDEQIDLLINNDDYRLLTRKLIGEGLLFGVIRPETQAALDIILNDVRSQGEPEPE